MFENTIEYTGACTVACGKCSHQTFTISVNTRSSVITISCSTAVEQIGGLFSMKRFNFAKSSLLGYRLFWERICDGKKARMQFVL